jgi:hypothetical protein
MRCPIPDNCLIVSRKLAGTRKYVCGGFRSRVFEPVAVAAAQDVRLGGNLDAGQVVSKGPRVKTQRRKRVAVSATPPHPLERDSE